MTRQAIAICLVALVGLVEAGDKPRSEAAWLEAKQDWQRESKGPALALGKKGAFDDTHVLSPCVARADGKYLMWYSGSSGTVAGRVFQLGLATSKDGDSFERHARAPVLRFKDGKRSILTPTVLRRPDGSLIREAGNIRMWFSATDFKDKTGKHTLHEATSKDGVNWSEPSRTLLDNVYAPTVLKEKEGYRLWYTDVAREPWVIRHAVSKDGRAWQVTEKAVLQVDQKWEQGRLFYPFVVKIDDIYLMWYGSYWSAQKNKTALGFAVSKDGIKWKKSAHNPVVRPDSTRAWESHYNTSETVIRLPDGGWRIWYASRKAPPFTNKYFAIGTAHWAGLPSGR